MGPGEAIYIECRVCDAGPGEPCENYSDGTFTLHSTRLEDYAEGLL